MSGLFFIAMVVAGLVGQTPWLCGFFVASLACTILDVLMRRERARQAAIAYLQLEQQRADTYAQANAREFAKQMGRLRLNECENEQF